MAESAAIPAILAQSTDRVYFIERFYTLVAGASEDRIGLLFRKDVQSDALHAAYAVEAWLEEVQAREEKYDRLATLARAVQPVCDLLQVLSRGSHTEFHERLIAYHEKKHVQSILAQRYELRQSAGEAAPSDISPEGDPLSSLLAVVSKPDGRDDFVAWFQIGWLYWKRGVLDEAENAFRTAASFSQRQSQWYLAQSLRHEAFMQWKRGNFERSRATMRRAIDVRRDPPMLVEAARYSVACGQHLESQSFIDEALHADPFIFLCILSDSAFTNAITSTVDILVRQQSRTAETANSERDLWEETISLIRLAEKQGDIVFLPEDADDEFNESALPTEPDFPTAVFRAEQARNSRAEWADFAMARSEEDVAVKNRILREAEESLRAAEQAFDSRINAISNEQRVAEMVIQDEHDAVELPPVPPLKDEMLNGFVIGLIIVVVGAVVVAGLCQWRFGSIPPLVPVPLIDLIVVSPIVAAMIIFGIFGFVTMPFLRMRKAQVIYNYAAQSAEFDADQKLRKVANEAARERDLVRQEWAPKKESLDAAVQDAARRLRGASAAHSTLKRIAHIKK